MTGSTRTFVKFGIFARDHGAADGVPVLHLRAVPNRIHQRLFGGLHRRVAAEVGRYGPGGRHPGRHRHGCCAATGPHGPGRLRRRSQGQADQRHSRSRSAISTSSATATLTCIDGPGSTKLMPPGSQIPVDRTEPALDLDLLLEWPQAGHPGPQPAGRQRAHGVAGAGIPGPGGHPRFPVGQDVVVHQDVGGQRPDGRATDRQPQHRAGHHLQGRRPVLRRDRSTREAHHRAVAGSRSDRHRDHRRSTTAPHRSRTCSPRRGRHWQARSIS